MNRPKGCKEEYLAFLDMLSLSGGTNMYAAVGLIEKAFSVGHATAGKILSYWMRNAKARRDRII